MKKLLKVNIAFYILIITLIIFFIIALILLLTLKIEKSQIMVLEVNDSGKQEVYASASQIRKLEDAKNLIAFFDNNSYEITVGKITVPHNQQDNYIVQIKGITEMLPGDKVKISLIYGYQSIIHSLFSSGV